MVTVLRAGQQKRTPPLLFFCPLEMTLAAVGHAGQTWRAKSSCVPRRETSASRAASVSAIASCESLRSASARRTRAPAALGTTVWVLKTVLVPFHFNWVTGFLRPQQHSGSTRGMAMRDGETKLPYQKSVGEVLDITAIPKPRHLPLIYEHPLQPIMGRPGSSNNLESSERQGPF